MDRDIDGILINAHTNIIKCDVINGFISSHSGIFRALVLLKVMAYTRDWIGSPKN